MIDLFRRAFGRRNLPNSFPTNVFSMPVDYGSILGRTPAEMWDTQPYLRTVVTFLARNVAQLGLHSFERVSETDRQRLRDHPVSMLLGKPNAYTTSYELVYQLVADLALYDDAYWALSEGPDSRSGYKIDRIPPEWVVGTDGANLFVPDNYYVEVNGSARPMKLPSDQVLHFHGWSPADPTSGSSPVNALRQILIEQLHAQTYRQQIWERGGRVGAVLSRPDTAPAWSNEAKDRFSREWRAKWTGDHGPEAGGTPILEDGMKLEKLRFSAHEEQYVDAAKLALSTVAGVYHVNPTMIGQLDNANYSNVKEFRRMLYGDTLGPLLAQIEDRINTFLIPKITDDESLYVEFNIMEKLQGSFEEQAEALSSSVGRPWMTTNEARARQNLPSLGDIGDELVTPLNVLVGGLASPRDTAPKTDELVPRGTLKARAPETLEDEFVSELHAFFDRQSKSVLSRLGAKAPNVDWWDADRWNKELGAALYLLARKVVAKLGPETAASLGFDPENFDVARTEAWLKEVSARSAQSINETTFGQIEAALDLDDPVERDEQIKSVFNVARGTRAVAAAVTAVTLYSAFASKEAGEQVAPGRTWKRWITGPNPRPTHAAMNGESVPMSEDFSNGAAWPGDSRLGADELAGCNCSIRVYIP